MKQKSSIRQIYLELIAKPDTIPFTKEFWVLRKTTIKYEKEFIARLEEIPEMFELFKVYWEHKYKETAELFAIHYEEGFKLGFQTAKDLNPYKPFKIKK